VGDAAVRADLRVGRAGRVGLDALGGVQVERPAGRVQIVAAEVAQAGAAELPEVAPGHRDVGRIVRPRRPRPQPQVPVQAGRYRLVVFGPAGELRVPALGPDPGVDLAHRADRPGRDPLDRTADALGRVPLVAHLRGDAGLLRHLGDVPGLPEVVGQRLLAVDVLARAHGDGRDVGVQVVRRGAQDGVDRLLL